MTITVLEKLLKQQEQLEARIQLLKTKEANQKRKDDTRRKVLAGAYILEKHEKEGTFEDLVRELDRFLFRKNDRELFGLSARTDAAEA